jgi:hypothetical protein
LNNCKNYKIQIIFYNNNGFIQPIDKFVAGQKVVVFSDDFNNQTNWQINGGTWSFSGGYLRTNPQGSVYNNNLNTDVRLASALNIQNYDYVEAVITHRWRIEGDYNALDNVYDFAGLDVSNDNKLFIPLKRFWGINSNFRNDTFDITRFKTGSLYLRFKFYSDAYTSDTGWVIDKISILGANTCYQSSSSEHALSDFSKISVKKEGNQVILSIPYSSDVDLSVYSLDGSKIFYKKYANSKEITFQLTKKGLFIFDIKTNREHIKTKFIF